MTKYTNWMIRDRAPGLWESPQHFKDEFPNLRGHALGVELEYGDHGLVEIAQLMRNAIESGKRIALYADYDVDGTMSAVSWVWFFRAIGFDNYVTYIPCRFSEGYGVNLDAVKKLIHDENADLIITMDTGITANVEAAYCKEHNVEFICTDHHKIQTHNMPDCHILNPKMHPDVEFQELCGCGVTFVLLRKLAEFYSVSNSVWSDLLALCGMATICDVVPLGVVNHQLAKRGVEALTKSQNPVFVALKKAAAIESRGADEGDIGFRIGPRINAVGRLEHADLVLKAFLDGDPIPLVSKMGQLNDQRKSIQSKIVKEATQRASELDDSNFVVFLGDEAWHPGVVGIASSKVVEEYWKPTWLFQIDGDYCKGSARSIPDFDVTEAMLQEKDLWVSCGGHAAAGGYKFETKNLERIKASLNSYARLQFEKKPDLWTSKIFYDGSLDIATATLDFCESVNQFKPFGHKFEPPSFRLKGDITDVRYFKDKLTGDPKHTCLSIASVTDQNSRPIRTLFFNEVLEQAEVGVSFECLARLDVNHFRGRKEVQLMGIDCKFD